jgi:anti-sigma regulatory factor (Ser/Thr protein kinase)
VNDDHAEIEIRVISKPTYVCTIRQVISSLGESIGMDKLGCGDLALAIGEAVVNVIEHGYGGHEDQPIWIKASPVRKDGCLGLEIVVEDECRGVDLSTIQSRPLDEVRPGGLGVHLIHRIMDEVDYSHRKAGTGIRLKMCKFINTSTP